MSERIYQFQDLDIHGAIIIQRAIEQRKANMTNDGSKALQTSDKTQKKVIEELDQMHLDLDQHISDIVRKEEQLDPSIGDRKGMLKAG
jgi:hypothetical protein